MRGTRGTVARGRRLLGALVAGTLALGIVGVTVAPASAADTAVIGDKVWNDVNRNGRQDAGEPGVGAVTVTLYAADGTTALRTATTNAVGSYSFGALPAATYVVGFALPQGLVFTTPRAPGVPFFVDSDADPVTGLTLPIEMSEGLTNNTIDAGMSTLPLELTKEVVGIPVVADDLTTSVTYELTVTNTGLTPGRYDLSDTFRFADAVSVTDVTTESISPAGLPLSATFDGAVDPVLLTDQSIDGGATHTIRIVAEATVARDVSYDFRGCEQLDPEWRTGFLNDAALTSSGIELQASACAGIVMPPNPLGAVSITKEVLDPDGLLAGASFDVSYSVVLPGSDAVQSYELDLLAGDPQVLTGLPVGTRVVFAEPATTLPTLPAGYAWNEAAFSPASGVTVETPCTTETCEAEALSVTLTNSYTSPQAPASGGFTVTKVVDGDGAVPADTIYSLTYTLDDAAPVTVEITAGEPVAFDDVPAGTVVTLTEGALPDVDGVTWGEPAFVVDGVASGAGARLTIPADDTVAVVLTNTADPDDDPSTTPSSTGPTTTPPPGTPGSGGPSAGATSRAGTGLAATGADTVALGAAAGVLLLAGAALAARRRRHLS
ncbi:hypothetical protein C8046_09560 [Serinibacter arcticus]|uniref:Gram-positive cocci surface proteins LPxTG domain-containing protein n=1 Tax=Serinibacter arcticus TaxID=1655435 RepID=A0A2U1ZV71_9MICO|nr:SdrD B-like domain-containing protein [Serinibacter arcticus]PWD50861.1 hypothetical protein C8046_09560 [Serinibacter arcticus]